MNGLLDRDRSPRHIAFRSLHTERTVEGASAREVDLRLRCDFPRNAFIAIQISPVGRRQLTELVDRMGPHHHIAHGLTTRNRLDPSLLEEQELRGLTAAFAEPGHVRLVDDEGHQMEIPKEFFQHLARMIRLMNEGRAVVMMPVDEKFTTQAAANYLGVSRQHLVDLLERGEIPFHKTGTHRRVAFKDLLEYEDRRDRERHEGLNTMFTKIADEGKYEGSFKDETR